MKLLLTGATGFLGSHIAEKFASDDKFEVLATKRTHSHMWRAESFIDKLQWIVTDSDDWQKKIIEFNPDYIINAAWSGVDASDRGEWKLQSENIVFQQELLDIAKACNVIRVIGVGSQAEYGEFREKVNEDFATDPNSAYGVIKLASYNIMKQYCEINGIEWIWFRLFSAFGEREADNWLIPTTIKNILTQPKMDLTGCEQKYSYLYVREVADVFYHSCMKEIPSGVYNISSQHPRSLRDILEYIKSKLNPSFELNFGAIPYRNGQSMHNQGDAEKLRKYVLAIDETNFFQDLDKTIAYYEKRVKTYNKKLF